VRGPGLGMLCAGALCQAVLVRDEPGGESSPLVEWNESEGAIKRGSDGFRERSCGVIQFDTTRNRFLVAGDECLLKLWEMDNTAVLVTLDCDGNLPHQCPLHATPPPLSALSRPPSPVTALSMPPAKASERLPSVPSVHSISPSFTSLSPSHLLCSLGTQVLLRQASTMLLKFPLIYPLLPPVLGRLQPSPRVRFNKDGSLLAVTAATQRVQGAGQRAGAAAAAPGGGGGRRSGSSARASRPRRRRRRSRARSDRTPLSLRLPTMPLAVTCHWHGLLQGSALCL